MNICLLGNNLTNLVLANIFLKKKINVDIISLASAPVLKNTIRTIAISSENYKFLKENIKNFKNLGWPTSMIKIYSERNRSSELFEFKNKNQNNFYLLKYIEFYNLLKKNKFLKFVKYKNYNFETIKKRNYNLIINSEHNNLITKKFFFKKIERNYNSLAHTAIIGHKKINNKIAIQIFTNSGPLAFLPLSDSQTSIVFSNNSNKLINKKEFLEIINKYNHKYFVKKISNIESFSIKFSHLRNYVYKNILSFGDLIHKVHPLAGQGFNMTIRDIKSLSLILDENIKLGIDDGETIAQKFQEHNKHLNFMYGVGIDSINSFFKLDTKLKNNLSEPIFKILKGNKFLNNYATFFSN
jgi:2-octaprenyl-6-methoxyphenol hydroxylase